jgi:hypothetical protein
VSGGARHGHAGLAFRAEGRREKPRCGGSREADALLVLRAARDRNGRCWLLVRLPSRPNNARGWVRADRVALRSTHWRIVVSRRSRMLTVYNGGHRSRRFGVVVGKPSTPTPRGLFSVLESSA